MKETPIVVIEDVGGSHTRTIKNPLEAELSPPDSQQENEDPSSNQSQGTEFCQLPG